MQRTVVGGSGSIGQVGRIPKIFPKFDTVHTVDASVLESAKLGIAAVVAVGGIVSGYAAEELGPMPRFASRSAKAFSNSRASALSFSGSFSWAASAAISCQPDLDFFGVVALFRRFASNSVYGSKTGQRGGEKWIRILEMMI